MSVKSEFMEKMSACNGAWLASAAILRVGSLSSSESCSSGCDSSDHSDLISPSSSDDMDPSVGTHSSIVIQEGGGDGVLIIVVSEEMVDKSVRLVISNFAVLTVGAPMTD